MLDWLSDNVLADNPVVTSANDLLGQGSYSDLLHSPLFALTLSLAAFQLGNFFYRRLTNSHCYIQR